MRVIARLAILAILCIAVPARASVDGVITGVVDDALLHPLPGAAVVLHDSAGNTVAKQVTGPDGKFAFTSVPFGDYTVEASAPGLVGDHQHLQLSSSQVATVELTLVNSEEIVTIEEDWAVPQPSTATGSVATVTRQTLQELPGTEDRPITDVVATQPGFVVDALGNLYARGNHANIQYQVDGVPIPDSVGSLFAASIPVRLIQGLEIYTGGMPAEFGQRLGAVVNLNTRQSGDHPEGAVQLRYGSYNTVEPGFTYASKLSDRTGMFVGGSLISSERALDPPSITPILHDDGYSGRLFARVDYTPCEVNHYEMFATYAHNHFQIPLDPSVVPLDPSRPNFVRPVDQFGNSSPPFIPHDTNATETEDEAFAAVSWVHKLDGGQIQLAPLYKLSRGALVSDASHALGSLADPGSIASDVTRLAHHAGGIAAYSHRFGAHLLKLGAQADFLYGTTDFAQYARDDAAGGIDPAMTTRGRDHTDALTSGLYAQDHWTHDKLALDLGIRFDELHVMLQDGTSDDSAGISPRFGASYAFSKDTVGHIATGINWQPPSPIDAANAARTLGVVPADQQVTYDLKPETDVYGEAGIQARVKGPLSAGLTAWGRYAWNQLDDTAIGSTSLLSNYNFQRGRAGGVEANVELRVGPWLSGFANGSYGIAEGRGISSAKFLFSAEDLANNAWQTLDHAQTFTANGGATVRDGRFSITSLVAYGSGLRTGPSNTAHVPGHTRTDLSMQYTFLPHAYPFRVGVDVLNVFNEHYAFRIANGFVGSSYGAPRTVFLSLSVPLSKEPHHPGEK
ncbi:MAG: putative TonB-dependent receptor precursor [Myxococcales bacterium]|nr:putative TonB-dependent receptor precursor [Myxococcales bacterium]